MASGTIAEARVNVRPDLGNFKNEVKAKLDSLTGLKVKVGLDLDFTGIRQQLRAVTTGLSGAKVEVEILFRPMLAVLRARLEALVAAASRGVRVEVDVDIATSQLAKTLKAGNGGLALLTKTLAGLGAIGGVIPIIAGVVAALQQLAPAALLAPAAILALGAAFLTARVGMSGFFDAVKSGDFSKLSSNAAAAAKAVRSFADEWRRVQQATQQALFENLEADIKSVAGVYLPLLERKLPLIAKSFNEMGRSVAFALTRPSTSNDLSIVLTNTAKTLHNARNAVGAFVSGFSGLAAIGSTYLPNVGRAIDGVAQKFEAWVKRAGSDGSIRRMIDDALQGFRDLGAIVSNVSSVIGSVFRGLSGNSVSTPLANLRAVTDQLRVFFESIETQTALGKLGDALRQISDAFRTVLAPALDIARDAIDNFAPVLASIASAVAEPIKNVLEGLRGPLNDIGNFFETHKDAIAAIAVPLLEIYAALKLWSLLRLAGMGLAAFVTNLGGLARVLKVGGFLALGAIAVDIDRINVAAAGGDPEKLTGLAENLHDIVGAGKQLLALDFDGIGADIASEWQQLVDGFTNGTSPIGAAAQSVSDAFATVGRVTSEQVGNIGRFFSDIGTNVSTFVTDTGTSIGQIGTFFSELPTKIGSALSSAGSALLEKGRELVQPIVDGARQKFEDVKAFFSQSPYEIGYAIGTQIGILLTKGGELVEQLRLGAVQKFEEVKTFFGTTVPQGIADSLVSVSTTMLTKGAEIVTALGTGASQAFENVKTFFGTTVPEGIANALLVLGPRLAQSALDAWEQFKTSSKTKIDEAVAFVQDIPRRIGEALGILPSQTQTAGTATGDGFKTGATSAFGSALAYISSIPGLILRSLGNLGSLLVSAGKSLMDGLLAGIKSGYNAMIDFVAGIAAGIAAAKGDGGTPASALRYDRKVLKPAGLALMQGLHNGLQTGFKGVLTSTGRMAGQLADAFEWNDRTFPDLGKTSVSGSPVSTQYADLNQVVSGDGFGSIADKVSEGVALGLAEWSVQIDRNGLAKLVNKTNNERKRR